MTEAATPQEKRLIKVFLGEYKKLVEQRTNEPFHPRTLAIISQPNLINDAKQLDWVAYHKWFDELDVGVSLGDSNNLIQAFLEIPIHVLISAEEAGKPLLSTKDQKKLTKALKLLGEIEIKPQEGVE